MPTLPADADGFVFGAEETYDPPTLPLDAKGQGKPYAVYGYGAQIAELEVDMKLGTVKLIKITAAHDVGKAINPLLVEGQIEGGIAQGIGMALMEEYIPGRTENLHDYLIPTIGDVPPIETILVEVPDPEGPFGAKGLGEHVLIPTAPAILNAIRHATGVLVTKVPATPTPRAGGDPREGGTRNERARRTLRNRTIPARSRSAEKIRCDACPVMCYIADGRTGACDRYGNVGGRIVRLIR